MRCACLEPAYGVSYVEHVDTPVLIEIMRNSFVINYFEAYAVELGPFSAESPLLRVYEKVLKYTI